MSEKREGGVKNLKKGVTSFMDGPLNPSTPGPESSVGSNGFGHILKSSVRTFLRKAKSWAYLEKSLRIVS